MTKFHASLVVALLGAACGGSMARDSLWSLFDRTDGTQVSAGTELTADASVLGTSCSSGQGVVTLGGTLSTNGATDPAQVLASVDDGVVTEVGEIPSRAFVGDGALKSAEYAVSVATGAGTHTVRLCFLQSASQGHEPRSTCAQEVVVDVVCEEPSVCGTAEPFGSLAHDGNLCGGLGPPKIPVHVRGDLGEAPVLSIAGPGGYSHEASLRQAGASCNYHHVWDTAGNGGPGTYAFVVSGNGETLEFSAQLHCR